MRRLLSLIAIGALFCAGVGAARGEDSPEKAAQKAAESWMPLWDSGKYEESYEELAEHT